MSILSVGKKLGSGVSGCTHYFTHLRVIHTSVSWWFSAGVRLTASHLSLQDSFQYSGRSQQSIIYFFLIIRLVFWLWLVDYSYSYNYNWCRRLVCMYVCMYVCIIIIIIYSLEFFTSALADGFSLESEWQQVSSSLRDSSQYSGCSWERPEYWEESWSRSSLDM